jgi:uncharacterized protein YbjQ (UPF0145 family)
MNEVVKCFVRLITQKQKALALSLCTCRAVSLGSNSVVGVVITLTDFGGVNDITIFNLTLHSIQFVS